MASKARSIESVTVTPIILMLLTFAGLSFSRRVFAYPRTAANPIEEHADPTLSKFVHIQNTRAWEYLTHNPLWAQLKERGESLAPQNAPVVTNFFDMDFTVSGGSLVLLGKNGSTERVVVDVNDKTKGFPPGAAVTGFRISPDQKKLAYGYEVYGNDWTVWHVIGLDDQHELAGPFYIKTSSADDEMNWDLDSAGLYYGSWLTADDDVKGNRRPQIRYHRLGTPATSDSVVFEDNENPHTVKYNAKPLSADTVIIYRTQIGEGLLAVFLVKKYHSGFSKKPVSVISPNAHYGKFLGTIGNEILLRTSELGSSYGILAVDSRTLRKRTIKAAARLDVLTNAQQVGDKLILHYLDPKLNTWLVISDLSGRNKGEFWPHDNSFPDQGTLSDLTGDGTSKAGYFTYQSVAMPPETFKLDAVSGKVTLVANPGKTVDFDGSKLKLELTSFKSEGGKDIPVFLVTRKDVASTPNFVYVFANGNAGLSNLPQFNRKFQLALELGGAVAIVCLPGGGEFGADWQKYGTYDKKRQFHDLGKIGEWLKNGLAGRFSGALIPTVLSGQGFGGMMVLSQYVKFQGEFDKFVSVGGIADPVAILDQNGWSWWDNFGFTRDDRGMVDPKRISAHMAYISGWDARAGVSAMKDAKAIMMFSGQNDTRVESTRQASILIPALQKHFGSAAHVYAYENPNAGYLSQAEYSEEASFLSLELGLTKLNKLTRQSSGQK